MPAIAFTDTAKAQNKQKRLIRLVLGVREERKISWDTLARACDESRTTFKYRLDNGLLEAWEWMVIWKVLGIETEDIIETLKL